MTQSEDLKKAIMSQENASIFYASGDFILFSLKV